MLGLPPPFSTGEGGEGALAAFSMSLGSLPRESLNDITTGNLIRNVHWIRNVHVHHDVFKEGNTAGEYTECGSSPQDCGIKVICTNKTKQNIDTRNSPYSLSHVPVLSVGKYR
jgi:hypothetical protein